MWSNHIEFWTPIDEQIQKFYIYCEHSQEKYQYKKKIPIFLCLTCLCLDMKPIISRYHRQTNKTNKEDIFHKQTPNSGRIGFISTK